MLMSTLSPSFLYPLSYVFGQKSVVKIFSQLCVHAVGYKKIAH